MKKLLYFTFVLGALFLTASCDREGVLYEVSEGEVCATFRSDATIIAIDKEDAPTFTVELVRGLTSAAVSIPVTITDANGIFTADKTQFDFAAGENTAVITFTYDGDDIAYGAEYEIDIEIDDPDQVALSGYDATTVVVSRNMTPLSKGTGKYYSGRNGKTRNARLLYAQEAPEVHFIEAPYADGVNMGFTVVAGAPVFSFSIFDTGMLDPTYGADYGNCILYLSADPVYDSVAGTITIAVTYCIPYNGGLAGLGAGADLYTLPDGATL